MLSEVLGDADAEISKVLADESLDDAEKKKRIAAIDARTRTQLAGLAETQVPGGRWQ